MNHSIAGCLEAIQLCYTSHPDGPQATTARLQVLYENIFPQEERSTISTNEYESSLKWKSRLIQLFEEMDTPVESIWEHIRQVEDKIIYKHLLLDLIKKLVSHNRIQESYTYIEQLPVLHIFKEEDQRFQGYRVLLKHYAELADAGHFFESLAKSEPVKERHVIDNCKSLLVTRTTETSGWEAGIALCNHKKIGNKYYLNALRPLTQTWDYEQMKRLFDEHPELDVPKYHTRLLILIQTFCQNSKRNANMKLEHFDEVFEWAQHTDPSIKWGDARLRDGLLMDIGLASTDMKRIAACKKAITNNSIKKELNFWTEHLKKKSQK